MKKILVLLVSAVFIFSMAACSGSSTDQETSGGSSTVENLFELEEIKTILTPPDMTPVSNADENSNNDSTIKRVLRFSNQDSISFDSVIEFYQTAVVQLEAEGVETTDKQEIATIMGISQADELSDSQFWGFNGTYFNGNLTIILVSDGQYTSAIVSY